ncbi:undecaprenyl-diphosphatase [Heyndrickxia ginsengihumi]|uniref:UDP-diphosphatase n=1 Tax=Heyndrickxia ginsengihumi TaxID=363870 RepID=A0A0A6VFY3_9BACI|nr:undecaprenyl-diphosphatase [Heyndrickxia ginsengihumi]KHD86491.1 UDP-diphosphatase [Heyndrickxia ginsengihumi]MBE6182992.1 undecaprenyl-diphosphatase [Bacillus sp. (in: firmicutes)]MCM3023308.1 undecaprenyl-diphosphatase [Heyndrickxia ginsengihumi]NEY19246.1 undecaprenyl-diphosphatase [Heyndrickxia ginsengihumi]
MNSQLFFLIHNLSGHSHLLDDVMIFFTSDAFLLFAIVLLIAWLAGKSQLKSIVLYAGITGIVGLLLNVLIGSLYYEPRPFVTYHIHILLPHAKDDSFPSDHATGTFAIAFALWLRNRKLGSVMIGCAILTGISRVYVGHHYPMDVAASIVIALVVSIAIYKVERYVDPLVRSIINGYNSLVEKLIRKRFS